MLVPTLAVGLMGGAATASEAFGGLRLSSVPPAEALSAPTTTLRGVVRDSSGPVVGATVNAFSATGIEAHTSTGSEGSYSLPLTEGSYYFGVQYRDAWGFIAGGSVSPMPITGEVVENISLPAKGSISVAVLNANSTSATGVRVFPERADKGVSAMTEEGTPVQFSGEPTNSNEGPATPKECVTGATGECEFEALAGEPIDFAVEPPVGLSTTVSGQASLEGNTVTARLSAPTTTLRGVVRDSSGPVVGATVNAFSATGIEAHTSTGSEGSYSLPLTEGSYYFGVQYRDAWGFIAGGSVSPMPITGEVVENISLPAKGSISVAVLNANSTSATGVRVFPERADKGVSAMTEEGTPVQFSGEPTNSNEGPATPKECVTGATGECEFEALAGEPIDFAVEPPVGLSTTVSGQASLEGNTVTARLSAPTTTLRGVVRDSSGPVVGATVNAFSATGIEAHTSTGSEGSYSLPLTEGSYYFGVQYRDAWGFIAGGSVSPMPITGEVVENISLPAKGSISVAVLNANSTSATGVRVFPERADKGVSAMTEEGTPVQFTGEPTNSNEGPATPKECVTGATGECEFEALAGEPIDFAVEPPVGLSTTVSGQASLEGNTVTARLGGTTTPPTVTRLSLKKGPAAGGTLIVITGTSFVDVTAVDFGAFPASHVTVNSPTSITVTTPPATSTKETHVTVTTASGTSAASSKNKFAIEAPTIASVIPTGGPRAGGTAFTVQGSGFAIGVGATTFAFGKADATQVSCPSTGECTATTPASAKAKTVAVVALIGKEKSKKTPAAQYAYH